MVYRYIYLNMYMIYMVLATEGFLEKTIESCSELDLNLR